MRVRLHQLRRRVVSWWHGLKAWIYAVLHPARPARCAGCGEIIRHDETWICVHTELWHTSCRIATRIREA